MYFATTFILGGVIEIHSIKPNQLKRYKPKL